MRNFYLFLSPLSIYLPNTHLHKCLRMNIVSTYSIVDYHNDDFLNVKRILIFGTLYSIKKIAFELSPLIVFRI